MENAQLYSRWLDEHGITDVTEPAEDGFFDVGTLQCLLPFLLAFWKPVKDADPSEGAPTWQGDTWSSHAGGWTRFLRADQALEWIAATCPPDQDPMAFAKALRNARSKWLVPIDEPFARYPHVLDRRVEVVHVQAMKGILQWSRRTDLFPNAMRKPVEGLEGFDPVHTPENARAGLTRYLSKGWRIDDLGRLTKDHDGVGVWGPSSDRIAYKLHNTPRRVMLGASLQTRAVHLQDSQRPHADTGNELWTPSGCNLRVAFCAMEGWNHEDAIVLSESAAKKLTTCQPYTIRILVPAVVGRLEFAPTGQISAGQRLVRASIDLFALGHRRYEAESMGATDGWLEIDLRHSEISQDAELRKIQRRPLYMLKQEGLHSMKWRELLVFHLKKRAPVGIGDKLATPHGIRGVVSKILSDEKMPPICSTTAEIALSPVGIAKRGAMGQFREADPTAAEPPKSGTIFVVRQPQDALPRCRVCGKSPAEVRGQRYGEMEFWALMAHGARHITAELLSFKRTTARWMIDWESKLGSTNSRKMAVCAVNRFLATLGMEIRKGKFHVPNGQNGTIIVKKIGGAFDFPLPPPSEPRKVYEMLDDADWFRQNGGLGAINLDDPTGNPQLDPIRICLAGPRDQKCEVEFKALHVLPPWLRPKMKSFHHPLTKSYAGLITAIRGSWSSATQRDLPRMLQEHVELVLGTKYGLGAFLRREVLGRRLTRSARAVIIPRPDLRIDQISIPRQVADQLFEGLPEVNRELVLVNRNPTLHRRGLLAMRPQIDESNTPVFGLPLGVLGAMGADFDGDQVCVVALETDSALEEAKGLVPGTKSLRCDSFRPGQPAFPLCKELSSPAEESSLAIDTTESPVDWCQKHDEMVSRLIKATGDGWESSVTKDGIKDNKCFWDGLDEPTWLERARSEMETVYTSVRKKGQLGGILRRQLYRRPFYDFESFQRSADALHAVTERLTQSALSVKAGEGAVAFPTRRFFDKPHCADAPKWLEGLDRQLDHLLIASALGSGAEPAGLLAWLAKPTLAGLVEALLDPTAPGAIVNGDPRLAWFLDLK